MTRENLIRLEGMLGRAYTLASQVINGDAADSTLAEEVSGECSELLALVYGDMGAFGQPELIDPELLALASALQPQEKTMKIYRAWVNQPSTLQPLHHLHGKHCIAQDSQEPTVRLWFTEGDTHSMQAPRECISQIRLTKGEGK